MASTLSATTKELDAVRTRLTNEEKRRADGDKLQVAEIRAEEERRIKGEATMKQQLDALTAQVAKLAALKAEQA